MDNNVIAKVGNIEITKQHMINIIRSLPQQQAMEVSTQAGAKRLLDEMIAGELLYLDALDHNVQEEDEFKTTLEEATHGLLQRYAIQKLLQNITATDEEVQLYYEKNKNKFISSDQLKARHILVEKESEAKKIKGEIEGGLDFSEAAQKYSTCPSKEKGGDLGLFEKGRMVPEFEEVAFALEVGELSDLVKTSFGYHLIMVDEKIAAGEKTFEEVASQLNQMVVQEKQGEVYDAKLTELKAKYVVEVNEEAIK
ncbi:MAG: peptidylprolyl isomerase [Firmicutes bacterium HGW-Firmicutes-7]|nr:MAG: peptidylprolyl isomerase [Firmicutes bacterium HGW-Firmicutes-7]